MTYFNQIFKIYHFRLLFVVQVDISVVDINDCDPTFTQDVYAVNVSENIPVATSIAMVTALDCDLGENGRLRYTIISGPSVFSLDGECMAYPVRDYLVTIIYFLQLSPV